MEFEPGVSDDYLPMDPKRLLQRLDIAINTHDVENLLRCFQVDYESIDPAHPGNEFTGLSKLRRYWEETFTRMPDFRAELLRYAVEAETIWSEWHWHEERESGTSQMGVVIFGVEEGLIAWGRSYMETIRPAENDSGNEMSI